jgi:hypothetical protein
MYSIEFFFFNSKQDAELHRRKCEARAYNDSFDADTFKSSLESAMAPTSSRWSSVPRTPRFVPCSCHSRTSASRRVVSAETVHLKKRPVDAGHGEVQVSTPHRARVNSTLSTTNDA